VAAKKAVACKRPYSLGRRLELSDRKRAKILGAARAQLESGGFLNLTLDSLARESGVTRQTIYNLFGTKTGVLEALFDQLALRGGLHRMREVMQQTDTESLLPAFVKIFTDFWSQDRLFIRRIHGIAAIDPEFGVAVEARNRRRQTAAARIVDRLAKQGDAKESADKSRKTAMLWALTSFEFFDVLAEGSATLEDAADQVLSLAKREFAT
jgi:AcrR family transcriptional regulator